MINSHKSQDLLNRFSKLFEKDETMQSSFENMAFSRNRTFTLEVMFFSFILDAQSGFIWGTPRLIAKLFELDLVKGDKGGLPRKESYHEACMKIPANVVQKLINTSHKSEFDATGRAFHGLKVLIPDGTKISLSNSKEARLRYGESQGHYTQAQALGFYELSTGTFESFVLESNNTGERSIALMHMLSNPVKTLYLADAGYNGMAFVARTLEVGHEVLMQLKSSSLTQKFLKSRAKSKVIEVKLTRTHLKNHPDHQHLVGTIIKVRLIRTPGTSRLKSQVLLTTLLDEKTFTHGKLCKLYKQRYTVEVAFRHIKSNLRIEKIRKRKLLKIQQLIAAAVIVYNLSSGIRNRIKTPSILPENDGVIMHCFTLCIELVHHFCKAAIRPKAYGIKKIMNKCLIAIKNTVFIYKPWRSEPRICKTPQSPFVLTKKGAKSKEITKSNFMQKEYAILKHEYMRII